MVGPVDEQKANDVLAFVSEMKRQGVKSFRFEPQSGFIDVEYEAPPPPPPQKPAPVRALSSQERDELNDLRHKLRREEEALSV